MLKPTTRTLQATFRPLKSDKFYRKGKGTIKRRKQLAKFIKGKRAEVGGRVYAKHVIKNSGK